MRVAANSCRPLHHHDCPTSGVSSRMYSSRVYSSRMYRSYSPVLKRYAALAPRMGSQHSSQLSRLPLLPASEAATYDIEWKHS
jgi:hypothetical protein